MTKVSEQDDPSLYFMPMLGLFYARSHANVSRKQTSRKQVLCALANVDLNTETRRLYG